MRVCSHTPNDMKCIIAVAVISGLIVATAAHSTIGYLIANSTETGLWKHVLYVLNLSSIHSSSFFNVLVRLTIYSAM